MKALLNQIKITDADVILTKAQLRTEDNKLVGEYSVKEIPYNKVVKINDYIEKIKKIERHTYCIKTSILSKGNVRCHENSFYTDLEYVMYSILHTNTVLSLDVSFYQYLVGRSGQSVSIEGRRKHIQDYINISFWLSDFYNNKVNMSNEMKIFYKRRIAEFIRGVYSLYLSYLNNESKNKMKDYDDQLKHRYIEVYNANEDLAVKVLRLSVKVLRLSKFTLYRLLSIIYRFVNKIKD